MRILTLTTVFFSALLVADGSIAYSYDHAEVMHDRGDRHHQYGWGKHRYRHEDRHKKYRHPSKHHSVGRHGMIRLDIPVHIHGTERVRLRRLVRSYHHINPDHYRLRKVVVDNLSGGYARARLRVGDVVSGPIPLAYGKNHLRAPGYGDGRWVLGLRNARVDSIRLVLEPRMDRSRYRSHHRYTPPEHDPHRWFKGAYYRSF